MILFCFLSCLLTYVYTHVFFYDWLFFRVDNLLESYPGRSANRPRALAGGGSYSERLVATCVLVQVVVNVSQ